MNQKTRDILNAATMPINITAFAHSLSTGNKPLAIITAAGALCSTFGLVTSLYSQFKNPETSATAKVESDAPKWGRQGPA